MKIFKYFLVLTLVMPPMSAAQDEAWTWFEQKIFTPHELEENGHKQELVFFKEAPGEFSQLMFSWNAFRRKDGHFSFWCQTRDSQTKQWSSWHKMIEWGRRVQRSFQSTADNFSHYVHVRLETGTLNRADAFKIKIKTHDGTNLSQLKSIAVSLSDFAKFKSEKASKMAKLPSVSIEDVPKKAQLSLKHPRNNHLCSPTSCSMLVGYLTGHDIDPVDFAKYSFDVGLDTFGSYPFNTAHAFERCDGKVWFNTVRLPSFKNLHSHLERGIPVVVSVRGELHGAPKVYDKGHLMVVIGWNADKQRVICHDPAFDDTSKIVKEYPIKSFLAAWERSRRLAYIAEPVISGVTST